MGDRIKLKMPEGVSMHDMVYEWPVDKFTEWCRAAHKEAEADPDWWKNVETPLGLSRSQLKIADHDWKTIVVNLMGDGVERTATMINEEICLANDLEYQIGSAYVHRPHAATIKGAITSLMSSGYLVGMGQTQVSQVTNRYVAVYKISDNPPRYLNATTEKAIKQAEAQFLPENEAILSVHYGKKNLSFELGFSVPMFNLMKDGIERTQGEMLDVLLAANGIKMDPNANVSVRPLFVNIRNASENLVRKGVLRKSGETKRIDVYTGEGDDDIKRNNYVPVFALDSAGSAGVMKNAKPGRKSSRKKRSHPSDGMVPAGNGTPHDRQEIPMDSDGTNADNGTGSQAQ